MKRNLLELQYSDSRREPHTILVDDHPLLFTWRQRELLAILAETPGLPASRESLLDGLSINRQSLYNLVHRTRDRLGPYRHHLQQYGSCTTRDGRLKGFCGYCLVDFEVRWTELPRSRPGPARTTRRQTVDPAEKGVDSLIDVDPSISPSLLFALADAALPSIRERCALYLGLGHEFETPLSGIHDLGLLLRRNFPGQGSSTGFFGRMFERLLRIRSSRSAKSQIE
ncbi:MAG: hypothetical protein HY319_17255 [Armatimonadetes bacterium]|nr:hypothetical protein [Armatimonadota bacterium]